jgi:dihydrofolate reductase
MPSLAAMVARTDNNVIGKDNQLPWVMKSDLRRFREITLNHAIIMGRKTYDSIGKPLPYRENIVITRDTQFQASGVRVFNDAETAIYHADVFSITRGLDTIFVIGGGHIFTVFERLIDKVYLTEVHAPEIKGDAHFNFRFDRKRWEVVKRTETSKGELDQYDSTFIIYQRRKKSIRTRLPSEFLTPAN